MTNYLFLGPDRVSKKEAVEAVLKKHGIKISGDDPARCLFFASESGPDPVFNECNTPPFFGGAKAVIVHEAELLPTDRVKAYFAEPADGTVLIFLSEKNQGKFSQAVEKLFKQHGEVRMFWELFENKLEQWAVRKAKEYGLSPAAGFGPFLIERSGRSAQLIEQNIQILANYFGERPFSLEEAAGIIGSNRETTVFTYVDALFLRDTGAALRAARELFVEGESPLFLLAMANRQLQLLWRFRSARESGRPMSAQSLGVVATVFRSLEAMSARWRIGQLAAAGRILFDLEYRLKSMSGEMVHVVFDRAVVSLHRI